VCAGAVLAAMSLVTFSLAAAPAVAAEKITLWSHWADEQNKKGLRHGSGQALQDKNPGFEVEVVGYQEATADPRSPRRSRQEPAPTSSTRAGDHGAFPPFVDRIHVRHLEAGRPVHRGLGKSILQEEPSPTCSRSRTMPVLYYNKDLMKKAGVILPGDGRVDVRRLQGDRGEDQGGRRDAVFGRDDGSRLGRQPGHGVRPLAMPDRRSGRAFRRAGRRGPTRHRRRAEVRRGAGEGGGVSAGVSSIKLGESHGLFFGGKYAMFPMRTSLAEERSFRPRRAAWPLTFAGHHGLPTIQGGKGNDLSYMQVGGSYSVNAKSRTRSRRPSCWA
jgi:hypothetical protein